MMTSTAVFDRAGTVLGQPFVLCLLAEMVELEEEETRRLVAEAAAVLIAGMAECTSYSGAVADSDAVRSMLGARQPERVAELAGLSSVDLDLAELLVERIAPVVTAAVAEIRTEFELTETDVIRQLREERRSLIELGFLERAGADRTEFHHDRGAAATRNVAKVRVPTPPEVPSDVLETGRTLVWERPWLWSLVVVAMMVAIAAVIGAGGDRSPGVVRVIDGESAAEPASSSTVPPPSVVTAAVSSTVPPPSVAAAAVSGFLLNELLDLAPITFGPRSAELTAEGVVVVDQVADHLLAHPEVEIEIGGHTDNDGRASDNRRLSFARAESVAARLVEAGVVSDRLVTVGYGEAAPAVPNDSAANKALNRRIEFVVR